jgi:DNA-binding response OmpR family regulator
MNLSVLVIEGDMTVAGFFREVFSQKGWDVHVLRDEQGLANTLRGNCQFDIITVSYRFPTMNGIEIIRLIRRIGHRKDTPVIMVTGGHDATGAAFEAGANEVLFKPVEPHRLVEAVMRHSTSPIAR